MAKKKAQTVTDDEPKAKTLYTLKLSGEQADRLEAWFKQGHGLWFDYQVEHARLAYKGDRVNVVLYKTGKLVVQGKDTERFVTDVLEPEITREALMGYDAVHHPEWFEPHAGLDESGKGDLFGPLVVACVIADGKMVEEWIKAGVRDSKTAGKSIFKLEKIIRDTPGVVTKVVYPRMPKYNELYRKFGNNLNRLLAWLHGRALNAALDLKPVKWGLLDQFSKQPLVQSYVKDRQDFRLDQRTKAESDPVVAAASILARASFERVMLELSNEWGEPLLKGANSKVRDQAKAIVSKRGRAGLADFAKLHFKTAYEAQDLPVPEKPAFKR
jgi:ribonuclease HIII